MCFNRDRAGNTFLVYINVSVLALPFIETVNLKFTADFFLNLRWYEIRIDLEVIIFIFFRETVIL